MKRLYGWGIVRSMMIAYKNLFRKKITVQYPFKKLVLPDRARWALEIKPDEDGKTKCTACMICEKTCPDFIIKIDTTTGEDKSKHIDAWTYEIGACMMCGLCVEACPFDAIIMGHNYELALTDPSLLTIRLLEDVPAAKGRQRSQAAEGKKDAAASAGASAHASTEAAAETPAQAPAQASAETPAQTAAQVEREEKGVQHD